MTRLEPCCARRLRGGCAAITWVLHAASRTVLRARQAEVRWSAVTRTVTRRSRGGHADGHADGHAAARRR